MNIKRAIGFGAFLWIAIFIIVTILMFLPWTAGNRLYQQIILWILEIPVTLLLARWYFFAKNPTVKEGFFLWLVGLVTGGILDVAVTVPLFVKSYAVFYGNWLMYVGFGVTLLVCLYAGYEFDGVVNPPLKEEKK